MARLAGVARGAPLEAWASVLLALGALCGAGLAWTRSPGLARYLAVVAAGLAAIDLAGLVRSQLSGAPALEWAPLIGISAAAAVAAGWAGADLALAASRTDGRRRSLGVVIDLACALPFVVLAGAEAAALLRATSPGLLAMLPDPLSPVKLANRLFVGVLAWELLLAGVALLGPGALRAWRRSRRSGEPHADTATRHGGALLTALADELVPGMAARASAAAAAERERLAADLHARVVPELRRAIAANPARPSATDDLRGALNDVETLMAERHSVVLEEFGLVAALEWLAERVEDRHDATVLLEIHDGVDRGRPPRAVERAAFRVAMLAVDNAVRHAPGSMVTIAVATAGRATELHVADAGPGIDAGAAAASQRDGHRGLADMESAAAEVGATLRFGPGPGGTGTHVAFTWSAR